MASDNFSGCEIFHFLSLQEFHAEIGAFDLDYAWARAVDRIVRPSSIAQRVVDAELSVTLDRRIGVEQQISKLDLRLRDLKTLMLQHVFGKRCEEVVKLRRGFLIILDVRVRRKELCADLGKHVDHVELLLNFGLLFHAV